MIKLLYKWILVIIVAFFVAFPLGFIPLKFLEGITVNDAVFNETLEEDILVLYLFYVVLSFAGILLSFTVSLLIKSLATGEKLIKK